jgi:hypothetical protein
MKTFYGFLARGIDIDTTNRLIEKQYTINKLKKLKIDELLNLGISIDVVNNLLTETRPPIPTNIVVNILYKSAFTCCICRDLSQPIVIHHIIEWNKSKDHSEQNLVALCLDHHGLAHITAKISQNLTPSIIRKVKSSWENEVRKNEARAILGLAEIEGARWDYINHTRLFELAEIFKINMKHIFLRELISLGISNKYGLINDPMVWRIKDLPTLYLYEFGDGTKLYLYVKNLLEQVLSKLKIIDITKRWNRTEIKALIKPGIFISCQGAFYFKSSNNNEGRN